MKKCFTAIHRQSMELHNHTHKLKPTLVHLALAWTERKTYASFFLALLSTIVDIGIYKYGECLETLSTHNYELCISLYLKQLPHHVQVYFYPTFQCFFAALTHPLKKCCRNNQLIRHIRCVDESNSTNVEIIGGYSRTLYPV